MGTSARAASEIERLSTAGETLEVEFKVDRPKKLSDSDLIESAVCLANGRGGTILLGVENRGAITGLHQDRGAHPDPRSFEALVANKTVPSVVVRCEIVRVRGVQVAALDVPVSRQPVGTTDGKYKRRGWGGDGKPACIPFLAHEMLSRAASFGDLDISARLVPDALWDDLSTVEFERVRATVRKNPSVADRLLLNLSNVELVKALGLGNGSDRIEELTVGALLMFGTESALRRFVPTHEVAFQLLKGTRVAVNEFFYGPLVQIAEAITSRFDARHHEVEFDLGPVRIGIPDFSPRGFREAFHNALVHRDYARRGTTRVQWRDEGIEIASPGGFIEGVALDSILSTGPHPRNPRLAYALKRIGLVERVGRGIPTMYEEQLRYGRSAPSYSLSSDSEVRVLLSGGEANIALTRYLLEQEARDVRIGAEEMLFINHLERERRLDPDRAAALIGRPRAAALGILERLVEAGILDGRGEGARRVFRLSALAYAAIGDQAEHTRASGFVPLQQEQMVLRYLFDNPRVARRDVADLCQLDADDARRLLRKLLASEKIVLHGTKRGAWYSLSTSMRSEMAQSQKKHSQKRPKR